VRVLAACSLGGSGHLNPLRPLLRAAERQGHETLVAGPPALGDLVIAAGHRFAACGEPAEADVAPIRERLPVAPAAEASRLANRELFGRMATEAMLPGMARVFDEWRPELVLRDPCEYASAVVAHGAGIATHQVGISVADGESASISIAAPALERFRPGLADELRASPYLTQFPASLDPSPFPRTRRFHGDGGFAPGRRPARGRDRPRLYVSFGTVLGHMTIAADVYRTALLALTQLDADVLFTVGRQFDPADLGPLPPHVRVERWVEQTEVLGDVDAVVCHGGSGTLFGAIGAGVPVVVVPLFADQFENGRRVARAGAGLVVERPGPPDGGRSVVGADDAPRIAQAIDAVLGDARYRFAAGQIGDEMAATPSAGELISELVQGGGGS